MMSPEWLALDVGIKPAMRLYVPSADTGPMLERAAAAGLHAVQSTSTVSSDGGAHLILYLSREPRLAEQLRDAEAAAFPGARTESIDIAIQAHTQVGKLLGYPACCVASFCARLRRGVTTAADGTRAHEDFVAAEDAAAKSHVFHGRLNLHLRREHVSLIPFYPCRYDCPAALELAETLRAELARVDAVYASELVEAVSAPIWLRRDGRRGPGEGAIELPYDRP